MKDDQSEDMDQWLKRQSKNRAQIEKQEIRIQILDEKIQRFCLSPAYAIKTLALELLFEGDIERAAEYVGAALNIDEKIFDDLDRKELIVSDEMLGYKFYKTFLAKERKGAHFIRQDLREIYPFMYLIEQDFFKAFHLFQKLMSGGPQKVEAISFCLVNKYHYRYEVLIAFLIRLIYQDSVKESSKRFFWDALFVFNVDRIGIRHAQLMIRALEESHRLDELMINQLADLVFATLTSRHPEVSRNLRSQLVESFSVCPSVTKQTFSRLIRRSKCASPKDLWERLTIRPRKNLLGDYWLPLLEYLPEEYTTFLITLITEHHLDDEVSPILKSIEWTALKKIPIRKRQIFDAVSKCIQETFAKPNSEAAMKNLLPVWLLLLEEGDDLVPLMKLLEQCEQPWLQWALRLVKAILDPTQKAELLTCFSSILENRHPDRENILLFSSVICDWDQSRNEVSRVCWFLLNEQDPIIFQRAAQRLDRSLDKSDNNGASHQQLQETIWQNRQWPARSKAPVLYRNERFAFLLEALQHQDLELSWHAQGTIQLCDSDQWNAEESRQLITILLKQIHCEKNTEAEKALGTLARHQFNEVIPALLSLCSEAVINVDAIIRLGQLIDDYPINVIPLLLEALKNPAMEIRRSSTVILQYVCPQQALHVIPALIEKLMDHDILVRAYAASTLGQVGEHHADIVLPALTRRVNDTDRFVRAYVVEAFGHFSHKCADIVLPALMMRVNDTDRFMRARVVEVLGHFAHQCADEVIPVLQRALKDPDIKVQMNATKALVQVGQYHAYDVIPVLQLALKSPDVSLNTDAINALEHVCLYHANDVIPLLEPALKSPETSLHTFAIAAIEQVCQYHVNDVISIFLSAIEDQSSPIRFAAINAPEQFAQHHANEVIPILLRMIKDYDSSTFTEIIIRALSKNIQHHAREVIPVLLEVMKSEHPCFWILENIQNILLALGQVSQDHASLVIPVLLEAMKAEELTISYLAIRAVAKVGRYHISQVIPSLEVMIRDSDAYHSAMCVSALAEVAQNHTSEVIDVFLRAMKDPKKDVRKAAAAAVGQFGHYHASEAIFALVKMIGSDEITVLSDAFCSLEKLAEFYTKETLTFFLNTIKEKSCIFMTRWMPGHIENYDRLPADILSKLRKALIKITHCPRSYIIPLVDGSPKAKDISYAMIMLPLLCNYNLQLPLTLLPEENSLIPLSELVIAIAQLADPKLRATTASELRDYYALHKTQFIHQLADILQQQLTCVPDIVLLCQMINITGNTWLSDLSSWYKNKKSPHEWRFPLACLAQLLVDEGSSISLADENQLIICQQKGPMFFHDQFESKFVLRLLDEVEYYLKSLGLTYPSRLLKHYRVSNRHRFFPWPRQIPPSYHDPQEIQTLLFDQSSVT